VHTDKHYIGMPEVDEWDGQTSASFLRPDHWSSCYATSWPGIWEARAIDVSVEREAEGQAIAVCIWKTSGVTSSWWIVFGICHCLICTCTPAFVVQLLWTFLVDFE
jgi:hypothetical protein